MFVCLVTENVVLALTAHATATIRAGCAPSSMVKNAVVVVVAVGLINWNRPMGFTPV